MRKIFNFIYNYATAIFSILFYGLTLLDIVLNNGQDHYIFFIIALLLHILYSVEQREG